MKTQIISVIASILLLQTVYAMVIETGDNGEQLLHFGFKTENGQSRTEDIKFNGTKSVATDDNEEPNDKAETTVKPVEYRGGYSFISADGYEYTVLYKANKNGFQPYVTARKLHNDKN
ncbi:endocuticle structural glycoprotein SgAbd-5 isoform X1 [Ceratitis capitata]|uniref:endocuticle structural glycoprotein SgAbd-5 isoform X1 n=2 Tax=Ceratitis capitata TaxID=7213 RepID=UPI00032A02F8|nr:endocuticle structural glycoprotein SgAbd-5 isoform X1 [Ceratitis capitata]